MAGRLAILGLLLLTVAGCEHFESLRQGVLSTYNQELRQLGADIDRKEMAKLDERKQEEADAGNSNVTVNWWSPHGTPEPTSSSWQPASLADLVQLLPPEPAEAFGIPRE
jgi:hypothetical protein